MTTDTDRHVRFIVSGRVQGVFFRAATQAQARELGLGGYVSNLDDGRVEVYAHGARERIEALERWLWRGPSGAEVSAVQVATTESAFERHSASENFSIR